MVTGDIAGWIWFPPFRRQLLPRGPDDIYVSPSQIRRFNLRTVIPSLVRFARRKKVNAILRCES